MAGDFRVAVCKEHFSALRFEGRKLKFHPAKGPFPGQRRGKAHFVRRMAVFPDYNGPRIASFKCLTFSAVHFYRSIVSSFLHFFGFVLCRLLGDEKLPQNGLLYT